MKRIAVLLPFIFTLVSILQLYFVAAIAVSPNQIFRPLFFMWIVVLLLLYPVKLLTQDWSWTGVFLTMVVLGFYYSSDFFSTMLLSVFMFFLAWLIVVQVFRIKIKLHHFINILAMIGLFFVCYSLWLTTESLSDVPWSIYGESIDATKNYSLDGLSRPTTKRDIYYIILDDYARSDILQELFGYDNSEFINFLEELGFIVPENHHSNYPMTHLSLSATLNMEYLQNFVPELEQSHNRWLMKPFIDHSRVRTLLEKGGYQTISISSNWTITENSTTTRYYHPYPVMLSDFEGFILGSTPLRLFGPLLQNFASVRSAESQQKLVLYSFNTLEAIPSIPGEKFVFTHLILPHPPFVFDENGNALDIPYTFSFKDGNEYPGSKDDYKKGYIDQLQFVNQRLRETLSIILANSKNPPIIIIQADHGSGLMTDFTSLENTCIKERFSSFAAFYLPDVSNMLLMDDVAAVNTFRIIFNEYFDARLPLLEDKQYFQTDYASHFGFVDVTDQVNNACK